jgi:hypothetical protein
MIDSGLADSGIYRKNGCPMEFRRSEITLHPAETGRVEAEGPTNEGYYGEPADGDPEVMNNLGVDYVIGKKVPRNLQEAWKFFSMAVRQGQKEASYNLGIMYATGQGVAKSEATAARWFKAAADQGDAEAENILGTMHENGLGLPRGDADAAAWYRLAAKKWHMAAQDNLGRLYLTGRADSATPGVKGRWEFLSAANRAAKAAYLLGMELRNGSLPMDTAEAAVWLRLAAREGEVEAARQLGLAYEAGNGFPIVHQEAARWYQQAAERGNADAQFRIGAMYADGRGVPKDPVKAYAWLDIAARQGIREAAVKRDLIAGEMTRTSFYDAKRLMKDWLQIRGIMAR